MPQEVVQRGLWRGAGADRHTEIVVTLNRGPLMVTVAILGGGDGDAYFLAGLAGCCRREGLAFVKAPSRQGPRASANPVFARRCAAAPSRRW